MERICHRDRVPAVCRAGRDQVIPCGPFCPGQAQPAPFSQGSDRAGAGLSWVALTPCSAMGSQLHCPRSRSAGGLHKGPCGCEAAGPARGLQGALAPTAGLSRGPCAPEGSVPLTPSPLQGGEFPGPPCPVWVTWGEGGRPCVLPASCGTAAKHGSTNPKRVVAPVQ